MYGKKLLFTTKFIMKIFLLILGIGFLIPIAFAQENEPLQEKFQIQEQTRLEEQLQEKTQNQQVEQTLYQEQTEEQNQIEAKEQFKIKEGVYVFWNQAVEVENRENNMIQLKTNNMSAETALEVSQNTRDMNSLQVKLSNGKYAEVKIMPDTASATALEKLSINNCSEENNCHIQLKEVTQNQEAKAAYEVQIQKEVKFLWLFRVKSQIMTQIDAENGEVIAVKKSWWSFLTSDIEE